MPEINILYLISYIIINIEILAPKKEVATKCH